MGWESMGIGWTNGICQDGTYTAAIKKRKGIEVRKMVDHPMLQ